MKVNILKAGMTALASIFLSWMGVAVAQAESQIDPQTTAALDRSMEGLREHRMPDGSVHMHLNGRFRHATVAYVDENGVVAKTCTADLDHAELLVSGALPGAEPKRPLPLLKPAVLESKGRQQ